jgi:hypothetical protein
MMTTRPKVSGVLAVLLLAVLLVGTGAMANEARFLETNYYLISFGTVDAPIASLIQTAQEKGFSVIVRSGDEISFYHGTAITEESEEVLLASPTLLYVDSGWFLLRVTGEDFDYTVRPTEDGYELVLVPHRDVAMGETLAMVLSDLQEMGIVGGEVDMEFVTLAKEAEKGPAPPEGVAIDSNLYGLTVAADWFSYAASKGLTCVGLRVEVVAEKLPGGAIPERFVPYIVSETEGLAKLILPIHQLVALARSSSIGYVRPPYQPQPAVP